MRKLSVAVLLSGREQFSVYYGGALARWTYEVYSRLREPIDVSVFGFPTDPESAYPLGHESSDWWRACALMSRVPVLQRFEDHLWLRALMPRLRHFRVVHIHNRPQWAGLLRSLGYRGAVVAHLQNNHLGHWSTDMLDALAPELDSLVACSTYLRTRSIGKSEALARKSQVIFNGVDTKMFCPREDLRESKTIFFVGSFIPEKGPLQLVEAYGRLLGRHPDARLIIGGSASFGIHQETDYVREVRRLAEAIQRQHGVSIAFPGYIHHDRDLPAFFQRATLFTSPSIFQEPFGLVNAEAMACATPVVGSSRGGIPEVLADTGQLIDPEDTTQYAEALSFMLSDATERVQMGRAALERCQKIFDWGVIAETWMDLLQGVTGEKPRSLECA
jgi:glycosyltransferase involved in cell wall biosynthesis